MKCAALIPGGWCSDIKSCFLGKLFFRIQFERGQSLLRFLLYLAIWIVKWQILKASSTCCLGSLISPFLRHGFFCKGNTDYLCPFSASQVTPAQRTPEVTSHCSLHFHELSCGLFWYELGEILYIFSSDVGELQGSIGGLAAPRWM